MDEAIRLLEAGKTTDRDKRGLVAEDWRTRYCRRAMMEELKRGFDSFVFTLSKFQNMVKNGC